MHTNQRNSQNQNEGEGSRTAARHYAAGVKQTIESGKVDELAAEASKALDSDEGDTLRNAEKIGKQGKPTA